MALVALGATGCTTSSQPNAQALSTGPSESMSASPAPSPSIDPRAQPAVDAYLAFSSAAVAAKRAPRPLGGKVLPEADFTKYSFDPFQGQYARYILDLATQKVAFRGTPPAPRVSVVSIDLGAKPYPLVVLTDCPTVAPTWKEYVVKTGKEVPYVATKVPLPYLATVEIVYSDKHWGAQKVTVDTSRTCTV